MAIELELFSFPLFVIKEIVKGNDAELENPAVHVANNSIAQGLLPFVFIIHHTTTYLFSSEFLPNQLKSVNIICTRGNVTPIMTCDYFVLGFGIY